jgi:nuclear-control-of-ATPase protein 2
MQTKAVQASEQSLGRQLKRLSAVTCVARMVVDFNRHHSTNLDPDTISKIETAAKYGDLSTIMPSYEKEIENPIKGALFGEFIRLILIQIQKQKGCGLSLRS